MRSPVSQILLRSGIKHVAIGYGTSTKQATDLMESVRKAIDAVDSRSQKSKSFVKHIHEAMKLIEKLKDIKPNLNLGLYVENPAVLKRLLMVTMQGCR